MKTAATAYKAVAAAKYDMISAEETDLFHLEVLFPFLADHEELRGNHIQ